MHRERKADQKKVSLKIKPDYVVYLCCGFLVGFLGAAVTVALIVRLVMWILAM